MKKVWSKPQVTEQEVGLEVTSYLPAEIETPEVSDDSLYSTSIGAAVDARSPALDRRVLAPVSCIALAPVSR